MIIVKYQSGKIERRAFAVVSGKNPIGSARPILDGAILEVLNAGLMVTEGGAQEDTKDWPWHMIMELRLGPQVKEVEEVEEKVILREITSDG